MSKQLALHGKYGEGKFTTVDDHLYDELNQYKWYISPKGYVHRYSDEKDRAKGWGKAVRLHRWVMNVIDSSIYVDHIDCNTQNNTLENLRIADPTQSMCNRRSFANSSSKYKNVTYRSRRCGDDKWEVSVEIYQKNIYGGKFPTEIMAARRADQLLRIHHGDFANLNFPDSDQYDDLEEYLDKNCKKRRPRIQWFKNEKRWIAFNEQKRRLGTFKTKEEAEQRLKSYIEDKQ